MSSSGSTYGDIHRYEPARESTAAAIGIVMLTLIEVVEEISVAEAAAEKPLKELGVDIQAHWVGAATFLGIIVTMIFTFYILKYGESAHTGRGQR